MMTKKLRSYFRQLPIFGTIFFFTGLVLAAILLSSKYEQDWSVYYIPLKILGAAIGFTWVRYWVPGGLVTYHIGKFTPTAEEKALANLIRKYRSKTLMLLVPISYIAADIVIGNNQYQSDTSYFDAFLGQPFFAFFITAAMTNGVKYISAWWNIRRHLKKAIKIG